MKKILCLACLVTLAVVSCAKKKEVAATGPVSEFPIDGTESVLTETGVTFDAGVSSDGNGSLKLEATTPTTFRIFEVTGLDIDDARLIYQAKLKADSVVGQAYLEMWCVIPELGEYFSRGLQSPLRGTIDWTTAETPFFLEKGQKPSVVKLNVVIEGTGTVWVDDIKLTRGPRQ